MKKKLVLVILSVLAAFAVVVGCSGDETKYVTVTFDLNYEGAAATTQTVVLGDIASTPDRPERKGYTFDGWYSKTENGQLGSEPFDFLETKIESDITLYAKWSEVPPEVLPVPTDVRITFASGNITVSATGDGLEYSYNDGEYVSSASFESGYAAQVKVAVRRKATGDALASDSVVTYFTTVPDAEAFTVADKANTYRAVTVTVQDPEKYEYKFNGDGEWLGGTEFGDLPEQRRQSVEIRVAASGDYPASDAVTKHFEIFVDDDTPGKVIHDTDWGGNDTRSTISLNKEPQGLCGENSVNSVKITDNDMSGYNSWLIRIPSGYSAFSADIKVIVNSDTPLTKGFEITNTTNKRLAVVVSGNDWTKIYGSNNDWRINFPVLSGTATIFLDNIEYFTDEEVESGVWKTNEFVSNALISENADAVIADINSKFDIYHGAPVSSCGADADKYTISTETDSGNGNEIITVANPTVKDISGHNGVSFVINMNLRGAQPAEGAYVPLYLVKSGKQTEAQTAGLSDSSVFVEIHRYGIEKVLDQWNGTEIVRISAEVLENAGYDPTDLSNLAVAYKTDYAQDSGGWKNIRAVQFYDFLLYR